MDTNNLIGEIFDVSFTFTALEAKQTADGTFLTGMLSVAPGVRVVVAGVPLVCCEQVFKAEA